MWRRSTGCSAVPWPRWIAAALKDGGDPTAAIGAVRKRNTDLQAERDRLLAANGFPADALDEKPSCAKCGDTGWVGAAMRDCLKLLCTQEQIKELSQTLDFGEQTFELFDFPFTAIWTRTPRGAPPAKRCVGSTRSAGTMPIDSAVPASTTCF
ncbi:MAG: hypothetical protein ACLSAF_03970 [Intestinimonas sp.]